MSTMTERLAARARSAAKAKTFQRGPFEVTVSGTATPEQTEETLGALDLAAAHLGQHGKLRQLLYGKVSLVGRSRNAAEYDPKTDSIAILFTYHKPAGQAYTIAHELGHRFWFKFLSSEQREEFKTFQHPSYDIRLFDSARRRAVAAEVVTMARLRKFKKPMPSDLSEDLTLWLTSPDAPPVREYVQDYLTDKVSEEELFKLAQGTRDEEIAAGEKRPALYVTPYGKTNELENFAEAVAHLAFGKALPDPIKAFLEAVT